MALFIILYYYLRPPQIYTGERKTPNLVSQIQRNFLLKDMCEHYFPHFFLINSEFILRVC